MQLEGYHPHEQLSACILLAFLLCLRNVVKVQLSGQFLYSCDAESTTNTDMTCAFLKGLQGETLWLHFKWQWLSVPYNMLLCLVSSSSSSTIFSHYSNSEVLQCSLAFTYNPQIGHAESIFSFFSFLFSFFVVLFLQSSVPTIYFA